MPFSPVDLRNQIIGSLTALSANTERVYMGMADAYPALVNEMRRTLAGTERMLSGGGVSHGVTDTDLLGLVDETRTYIQQSVRHFTQAHASDQEIHTVLAEQLESMSALSLFISHIHEDSTAMELISLNAMTVAFKAGVHGRAFSVITEELQRLSARTIDLTDLVTQQGQILIKRFSEFKQVLKEQNDQEQEVFGSFVERIFNCFEEFTAGVRHIVSTIGELRKRSEKIMEPLVRIMTEIQGHDLIRQSIDHVILSLQEIKPVSGLGTCEETMDELSFLELLPDLCSDLLSNIAAQIAANQEHFQQNLIQAQTIIDSIETERKKFIRDAMDSENPDGLMRKCSNSHQAFEQLFSDISDIYRRKAWTVGRSREVQYMVKELDSSFKSFDSLIARFRTIDIASRIEIAKQDVLFQMSGTVNEMTALTLRIEEDVAQSDAITSTFLETSQRLLEQYRKDYQRNNVFARHFIVRLRNRSAKLETSKDSLVDSINNTQVFTTTFLGQFSRTRDDLNSLDTLLADIKHQRELLGDIKVELGNIKKRYMAKNGISEWNLENQKLKAMIDRFTIFTHKKIAGDLGGFSVEEGVQSGDITFF